MARLFSEMSFDGQRVGLGQTAIVWPVTFARPTAGICTDFTSAALYIAPAHRGAPLWSVPGYSDDCVDSDVTVDAFFAYQSDPEKLGEGEWCWPPAPVTSARTGEAR